MSAPTMLPAWAAPGETPAAKITGPSMLRLTRIELRKMADTRAGRWFLIIIALIVALVIGAMAIWGDTDQTFRNYAQLALLPIGILGPVLGILTVTSEWSQRTALTTFTLVPQRGKVIAAKFLAAMVLATLTLIVILPIAALATAFASTGDAWDLSLGSAAQLWLFLLINFAIGVGFGLLFANTPVAIVSFFALPIAFTIISQFSALQSTGEWLDTNSTLGVLGNGDPISGKEWAQVGTSLLLWMVLPLVIGLIRTLRREVK
jgi:ABC-2 type transport system permease protein